MSDPANQLATLLATTGATAVPDGDTALLVTGLGMDGIGDLAFDNRIRLHELTHRSATLEEAFLEATEASQEYQAQVVDAAATPTERG